MRLIFVDNGCRPCIFCALTYVNIHFKMGIVVAGESRYGFVFGEINESKTLTLDPIS